MKNLENMKNLEIRDAKSLRGTLEWWDNLPKKTYVKNDNWGDPVIYLELEEESHFLAEIAHEDDDRCRQIYGCNVAFVDADIDYDQALFSFPISKKCREAIDEFIEKEIQKFVAWWKEA